MHSRWMDGWMDATRWRWRWILIYSFILVWKDWIAAVPGDVWGWVFRKRKRKDEISSTGYMDTYMHILHRKERQKIWSARIDVYCGLEQGREVGI